MNSQWMIKELVKSKMRDLEENRERNFRKEIKVQNADDVPAELILKDPHSGGSRSRAEHGPKPKHNEYSESGESEMRMYEYSANNSKGEPGRVTRRPPVE